MSQCSSTACETNWSTSCLHVNKPCGAIGRVLNCHDGDWGFASQL